MNYVYSLFQFWVKDTKVWYLRLRNIPWAACSAGLGHPAGWGRVGTGCQGPVGWGWTDSSVASATLTLEMIREIWQARFIRPGKSILLSWLKLVQHPLTDRRRRKSADSQIPRRSRLSFKINSLFYRHDLVTGDKQNSSVEEYVIFWEK